MIGSLASGAYASLVAKNGAKITFEMLQFSMAILCYLGAEIDYRPFILFYFKIMHKKFQVNSTKIEGMMAIFVISSITKIIVYR